MGLYDSVKKLLGLDRLESFSNAGELIVRMTRDQLPARRSGRAIAEAFHDNPILGMSVSKIAHSLAAVSWHVQDGETRRDDHPALSLLRRPNGRQTGYVVRWITHAYLDTLGEAIWLLIPSSYNGSGVEALPIPPFAANRRRESGETFWDIRLGNTELRAPTQNVLWIKRPNLCDLHGRGAGMGETLADELDVQAYATEHMASELFNHARPDGLVHLSGAKPKEYKALKEKWYEEHGGPQNSGKLHFSGTQHPDGRMDYVQLSRSLADVQAIEIRGDAYETARRAYGIPPEIVGDSKDSNRATIEAAYYIYSLNVLRPRLSFLKAELNHTLLPMVGGPPGQLDHEKVVPEDKEFQAGLMERFPQAFYVNEARTLAGKDRLDEFEGKLLEEPRSNRSQAGPDGPGDGEGEKIIRLPWLRTKSEEEDAERVAEDGIDEDGLEPLQEEFGDTMREFGLQVIEEIDPDISLERLNPAVQQKVATRTEQIYSEMNAHSRDQLKQTILEGFGEGKNPREVRRDIQKLFGNWSKTRSERVARTEMVSASNAGTHAAYEASDVVQYRSWLHTGDHGPDVRDHHREYMEETQENPVPLEQPFSIRGKTADHPGDFGDPEEDAYCRCSTVVEFPDDEERGWSQQKRAEFAEWWNKALDETEERMKRAAQKMFSRQLDKVLEAYDRHFQEAA